MTDEKLTIPTATPKKRATRSDKGVPKQREARAEAQSTGRRKRTPFGSLNMKLSVDQATLDNLKKRGMVARWINDDNHGQRIKDAYAGDYEFVEATGNEVIGNSAADVDKRIKKLVGTEKDGSPKYAYLMAIKSEYHAEDQAAKEQINSKVDETIRAGKPSGVNPLNISDDKVKMSSDVNYKT